MLAPALAVLVLVARAPDAPARSGAKADPALVVRVLDAETGAPLEGAEVESTYRAGASSMIVKATVATGADGTARVERDPGLPVGILTVMARKSGYVPKDFKQYQMGPDKPPPALESKEFRLDRGTELGGAAVDDAGAPIEGATVELHISFINDDGQTNDLRFATETDADGRWRTDEAPASLKGVVLKIDHPDYLETKLDAARGDLRVVLVRAETVTGRVAGPDGRPIADAKVDLRQPEAKDATTDADGRFTIRKAVPGETRVTVEADGFAATIRDVTVKPGAGADDVEVAMEPGATLRVRVVDADGRPLRGVEFHREFQGGDGKWAPSFRERTDADGRATRKDLPPGEADYEFTRDDLMTVETSLTPGGEERAIVMRPALIVSGTVIDAVTKRPVPEFRVERGETHALFVENDRTFYPGMDAKTATDGRYSLTFNSTETSRIRITAPGYRTAESPAFRVDEPGAATRDFALDPRPWLEGVVRHPDDDPDPGAKVATLTSKSLVELGGAEIRSGLGDSVSTADAEGRFALPRPDPPFLLVAASESGFVTVSAEDLAKSSDLRLRPWGRIEGTARIGDRPAAGARVEFESDENSLISILLGPWMSENETAVADARGRFVIERVVPGGGRVGRRIALRNGLEYVTGETPAVVKPGETARVDLGGGGRPVVGRATFDGPVDWLRGAPVQIVAVEAEPSGLLDILFGDAGAPGKTYLGDFDRDGRFRVDDVPPGRYRLNVHVSSPFATTTRPIVVPEGDPATPFDVGEIAVTPRREK